jgi:superfamily II DNA/RNA helicase
MLDMGFEKDIRNIVLQAKNEMPGSDQRQTMMFSATFPKPIQRLATDFMKPNYLFVKVGKVGSTKKVIRQVLKYVEGMDKRPLLLTEIKQQQAGLTLGMFVTIPHYRMISFCVQHLTTTMKCMDSVCEYQEICGKLDLLPHWQGLHSNCHSWR